MNRTTIVSRLRQTGAASRALLVLTVLLGIAYPLAVTGVAQVAFNDKANGQIVEYGGEAVGSRVIGQRFEGAKWFHPRPSAAGDDGYDGLAGGASNLGTNDPGLLKTVKERKAAVAKENGVSEAQVPPDAVTAGGSGLDPHISPAYAAIQVNRVAAARGMSPDEVRGLVEEHSGGRVAGVIGDPYVNVLELNLALERG